MSQASALSLPSPVSATCSAGPPARSRVLIGGQDDGQDRLVAIAATRACSTSAATSRALQMPQDLPDSTGIELHTFPPRYDDACAWSARDRQVDDAFHDQVERVMRFRGLRLVPHRTQAEPVPVAATFRGRATCALSACTACMCVAYGEVFAVIMLAANDLLSSPSPKRTSFDACRSGSGRDRRRRRRRFCDACKRQEHPSTGCR
jgi:hypothetical protein